MAKTDTADTGKTAKTKTRRAPAKAVATYEAVKDMVLMTVEQAAVFLGLKRSFLDNRRRLGGGPDYSKLGNRIRYTRDDLLAWVASQKHNGAVAAA